MHTYLKGITVLTSKYGASYYNLPLSCINIYIFISVTYRRRQNIPSIFSQNHSIYADTCDILKSVSRPFESLFDDACKDEYDILMGVRKGEEGY